MLSSPPSNRWNWSITNFPISSHKWLNKTNASNSLLPFSISSFFTLFHRLSEIFCDIYQAMQTCHSKVNQRIQSLNDRISQCTTSIQHCQQLVFLSCFPRNRVDRSCSSIEPGVSTEEKALQSALLWCSGSNLESETSVLLVERRGESLHQ